MLSTSFSIRVRGETLTPEDKWEDLIIAIQNGNPPQIGTNIPAEKADGTSLELKVVDVDTNGDVTLRQKEGIVYVLNEERRYPLSWSGLDARRYLNGTYYDSLPDYIKNSIKSKTATYHKGYRDGREQETCTDKIWMPVFCEVFNETDGNIYYRYGYVKEPNRRLLQLYENDSLANDSLGESSAMWLSTPDELQQANADLNNRKQAFVYISRDSSTKKLRWDFSLVNTQNNWYKVYPHFIISA